MSTPTMSVKGTRSEKDPATPLAPRPWLRVALWIVATALLVFVLPLWVPSRPVNGISASFLAGFNNTVAVAATVLLSVTALLLSLRRFRNQPTPALPPHEGLGPRFVGAVVLGSLCVLTLGGWLVWAAHDRCLGDAGYFIEQASTWNETSRRLYAGVEFAYGPLLLVPEALVARVFHLPMMLAYFALLLLESALGLCMLAYVLNQLPVRAELRRAALVLFALAALTPHLGLNYTFFRFASPAFLLLWTTARGRSPGRFALWAVGATVVQLAISPELAMALTAGLMLFGLLRTLQGGRLWLLAALSPAAALLLVLSTVGRPYLRMVGTFSRGVYNLPVGPYPHVLLLLCALLWLVPAALGRLGRPQEAGSARLLALYGVGLAMLPAALGRCDALHVLFNGVVPLCLALIALQWSTIRTRRIWLAAFALVVLWEHRVNEGFFSYRTAVVVQHSLWPHTPQALRPVVAGLVGIPNRDAARILWKAPKPDITLSTATLARLVGTSPIATPLEISPAMEDSLKAAHLYRPLFHAFGVDMMDARAEQGAVEELRGFRWLLLPSERKLSDFQQTPKNIGPVQGVRMYFRQRHAPLYTPGATLERDVAQNWQPVQTFGYYTLYRQREE